MLKHITQFEQDFTVTKAAGIVGFFTLLIKFVAIYRERLLSGTFGQGPLLDSYFSAFRIPDFLTNLFVLSTLSVAFLPIFTGLLTEDRKLAYRFANRVILITGSVMAALCLVLLAFSSRLVHALVPGFEGRQFSDTLQLTRLFLLSPVIFTLGTVYSGMLNAKKQFLVTSFAPLLYNVGIIAGVLLLYPRFGIMGLGYGVIAGALIQLLVQIIAARSGGYELDFSGAPVADSLSRLWRLYLPRIFSFDLSNVTLLLGTVIGSVLSAGSIAALNQAYNLQAVPVGIFGYSLAVAVFPVLSEHFALRNERAFADSLSKSITQTLFFIIPVSVLVLIYRAYVVRIILGTGNFDWNDTIRTFQVLGIFSFSFFSQSLTTLLSRAFFARHNTKIPVAVNIAAIVVNLAAGMLLGSRYGVSGLTCAFVLASVFNAITLYILLRRELGLSVSRESGDMDVLHRFDRSITATTWKVSLASIVMGLLCYAGIQAMGPHVNTHTVTGIVIQCAVSGIMGLVGFAATAAALRIPETKKALDFFANLL